jgi:hypothetical protein
MNAGRCPVSGEEIEISVADEKVGRCEGAKIWEAVSLVDVRGRYSVRTSGSSETEAAV